MPRAKREIFEDEVTNFIITLRIKVKDHSMLTDDLSERESQLNKAYEIIDTLSDKRIADIEADDFYFRIQTVNAKIFAQTIWLVATSKNGITATDEGLVVKFIFTDEQKLKIDKLSYGDSQMSIKACILRYLTILYKYECF